MYSFSHWVMDETLHRLQGTRPASAAAGEDAFAAGRHIAPGHWPLNAPTGMLPMTQDEFGFQQLILGHSRYCPAPLCPPEVKQANPAGRGPGHTLGKAFG